jgi:NADH dehydrogenase
MPNENICYNAGMILVTGGTGFIGGYLIRHLAALGKPYRLFLQPGIDQTNLPRQTDMNVALSSLDDERGVSSALRGVEVIYHLVGVERSGAKANLMETEVSHLERLTSLAAQAGVKRFFYLSHLGADRASAYGLMKAKGIAESIIRKSGLTYTIIRSSMVYGEGDNFTINLARLIKMSPGLVLVPGDGSTLVQPLWVEDLVTSLIWALDMPATENAIIEVGGPEHIPFLDVMKMIGAQLQKKRSYAAFSPVQLSFLTQFLENRIKGFPTTVFWMDYLAENRTCDLDSMPRNFGINPARMKHKIEYLNTALRR